MSGKDVFLAKIFHSAPDLHGFGVKDEMFGLYLVGLPLLFIHYKPGL